jgi:hypothetical protein
MSTALLAEAGHESELEMSAPLQAAPQYGYEPELPADYWMVGIWEAAEGGLAADVVADWGISEDDMDGWEDGSPSPYRGRKEDGEVWYDKAGTKLALWKVETYVQHNLRRYAAIWREVETTSLWRDDIPEPVSRTQERYLEALEGLLLPAPGGSSSHQLVDFECYREGGALRFLGVWREEGAGTNLSFERLSFQQLKERLATNPPPRVVDVEQCYRDALDEDRASGGEVDEDDAQRFLVLLEEGQGESNVTVSIGDWQPFHDAYHDNAMRLLEFETMPIASEPMVAPGERFGVLSDTHVAEVDTTWQYLWIWAPRHLSQDCMSDDRPLAPGVDWLTRLIRWLSGRQGYLAEDWVIVTDKWSFLEREVKCRKVESNGLLQMGNEKECGRLRCHAALQLVDLLMGAEEIPGSDFEDPQHIAGHGDGSGGPPIP